MPVIPMQVGRGQDGNMGYQQGWLVFALAMAGLILSGGDNTTS
jgi:hypothetical protein